MGAPPVAKTDLSPWRSRIDALLVGIAMSPVVRSALLDAFEQHGFLAHTKPEPVIAVDELGRLRKTLVNKALADFDENVRSIGLSLSWKSCRLSREVCSRSVNAIRLPTFSTFCAGNRRF